MKKKSIVSGGVLMALCGVMLLSSYDCDNASAGGPGRRKRDKSAPSVAYDTAVAHRLNDSVAALLFGADQVVAYSLRPLDEPTDNDRTIGGFKVESKIGPMPAQDVRTLQFLLADSLCYSDDPVVPLSPFSPQVALELTGSKGTVGLLFSFVSQEVGVVVDGKRQAMCRYTYARPITRLFRNMLDKDYYQYLMTLVK